MPEDFGEIYDQYVTRIYRFIFLKVPSQEIAEDLCSEVFVQTLEGSQKTHIANMQAFLYQVARNLTAEYYRNEKKIQIVSLRDASEIDSLEGSLLEEVMVRSEMEEVRKVLLELHDEYQNLIIWRYLDELSIPEIAQIEGKSEGSVRVRLHRALESLKKRMIGHKNVPSVRM